MEQIAHFYAEEFAYYRRSMAEREILVPRGMSFDRFLSRQATMAHWQVDDLDNQLASYYIDSAAIIAGIDPTGAHIYKIWNPGVAMCFDTPFFACSGAGESLATTQFMVARYDKTWPIEKAMWLTFVAKARAEMAGGVGSETDFVLIVPGQKHVLTNFEKSELYRLFEQTSKKEEAAAAEAIVEVRKYMETAAQKDQEVSDGLKQTTAASEPTKASEAEPPKSKRKRRKST